MTLELPPKIPETLTRIGGPPGEGPYYQLLVGVEDIALVLMEDKIHVASASYQGDHVLKTREVIDTVEILMEEIVRQVALAADVHDALGIEVRLKPAKES